MALYLVQSFKGANILTKLAFIFLFLALFCGWIAYTTASWGRGFYEADSNYYTGWGVWRVANNEDRNVFNNNGKGSAPLPTAIHADGWLLEWYGAFQAFATFGFICLNIGFFLAILFVFVAPCKSNSDLSFWNGINNIFGSICWIVAIALFGSRFDVNFNGNFRERSLHYSFGMAIVTFILQLAGGIVLLLTNRGGGAVSSK